MSNLQRPSFDAGIISARDPLAAAAASLAATAESQEGSGTLVIVVRPQARDYRVISADGGNGALRAAVSVMVASDNTRLWADVADRDIVELTVGSLPEVVRAASDGAGVTSVHVGAIRPDGEFGAIALWFGTATGVADAGTRRHVLDVLGTAADDYLELAAEQAAEEAAAQSRRSNDREPERGSGPVVLEIGSDDPDLDPLTGVASKARFDRALDEFEGDEATLLLIDLDHFANINDEHGTDSGDRVLQEIATRLANACRKTDLIARLDADEFGVILHGADRNTGLQVSKRLLTTIAEPFAAEVGPTSVTATVAFAHEMGLVDMEELLELADDAVASGKRAGRARIVIAS